MINLVIFNEVNELHPWNIFSIFSTLSVLKKNKFKDFKAMQSLNIAFILMTDEVSKFIKLADVKELHPWNI